MRPDGAGWMLVPALAGQGACTGISQGWTVVLAAHSVRPDGAGWMVVLALSGQGACHAPLRGGFAIRRERSPDGAGQARRGAVLRSDESSEA